MLVGEQTTMVKLTCKFPTIQNVSLIVLKHYLLEFNWYRAITQYTNPVNVLTTKLRTKIVRKGIPKRRSVAFLQLWPNGWMDQDATLYGARARPRRLCVRWVPRSLPKKGAEPSPQFSAHFYCSQTTGCIKTPLGMEVGLSAGDFVLDGDPACPLNFRPMFIIVIVISLEYCTLHRRKALLVCSSSS